MTTPPVPLSREVWQAELVEATADVVRTADDLVRHVRAVNHFLDVLVERSPPCVSEVEKVEVYTATARHLGRLVAQIREALP